MSKGSTVIELLIVVTIIMILAGIMMVTCQAVLGPLGIFE